MPVARFWYSWWWNYTKSIQLKFGPYFATPTESLRYNNPDGRVLDGGDLGRQRRGGSSAGAAYDADCSDARSDQRQFWSDIRNAAASGAVFLAYRVLMAGTGGVHAGGAAGCHCGYFFFHCLLALTRCDRLGGDGAVTIGSSGVAAVIGTGISAEYAEYGWSRSGCHRAGGV